MRSPAVDLEIITLYRGTVIDVRHLAPGEGFTIGPDEADLPLDDSPFTTPHRIAALDPDGRGRVDLPAGVSASTLVDGRVEAVERPGGLRLLAGHKARIDLGDLNLLCALVPATPAVPRAPVQLLDRGGRRFLGMAAALHAAVLAVAFSVPVQAGGLSLDRIDIGRWIDVVYVPESPKPEPAPLERWLADLPDEDTGSAAPGPDQVADNTPSPERTRNDGAPAPGEPEEQVALKKQLAHDTANQMKSALDDAMGDLDGALGGAAHEALNALGGGERGDALAMGGIGDRLGAIGNPGLRFGPGGGPSIGVKVRTRTGKGDDRYGRVPGGPKVPKRTTDLPRVIPQTPEVAGGLSREDIQRVVRANRNAIRYCYETALQRQPDLEGKVRVKFVVGADGGVLAAKAVDSTMGAPEVDACLASRIKGWQFPPVRGGGVVAVTYPFLFRAGGR